ncbi:MAG TPA: hypothetical protein VF251_09270 [Pyrinomonadaceae bacterium]
MSANGDETSFRVRDMADAFLSRPPMSDTLQFVVTGADCNMKERLNECPICLRLSLHAESTAADIC